MIDEQFKEAFTQLVQAQISRGRTRLDAEKIANYLSKVLNTEITVEALVGSLNNFPFVRDITGNVITVGNETPEEDIQELDDEEAADDVHDMAMSQAAKDMFEVYRPFRTLAEAIQYAKPNTRIKYQAVNVIDTHSNAYLMHRAGKSFHRDYIVESVSNTALPTGKVDFSKIVMRCRIDGSRIMVDLPITSIIKR